MGKTLFRQFLVAFLGSSQLFWSLNCPSLHLGQFEDQKSLSLAPRKSPSKWPKKCFARIKKNYLPHFQNQRWINSYYAGNTLFWFLIFFGLKDFKGPKKSRAPRKSPSKWPKKCFAQQQNKNSLKVSESQVHRCFYALVAYILI